MTQTAFTCPLARPVRYSEIAGIRMHLDALDAAAAAKVEHDEAKLAVIPLEAAAAAAAESLENAQQNHRLAEEKLATLQAANGADNALIDLSQQGVRDAAGAVNVAKTECAEIANTLSSAARLLVNAAAKSKSADDRVDCLDAIWPLTSVNSQSWSGAKSLKSAGIPATARCTQANGTGVLARR